MTHPIGPDDFNAFFGLSYSPYLVVPRSLLQSMPLAWQQQMVRLLEEMMQTRAGQRFSGAHYLARRTDPDRDAEIHEASLHNQTHDMEDQVDVPVPLFIDDPFRNYRYPSREIFGRDEEKKP